MVRSSSVGRFTKNIDKLEMELVYTKEITKNKETRIYGKMIEAEVYGRVSHVLVCYNPDVKQTKNTILQNTRSSLLANSTLFDLYHRSFGRDVKYVDCRNIYINIKLINK